MNFDGAIFKEMGAIGLGVVIRDFKGIVIGALAEQISLPNFVATVEALACKRAVLFTKEMSIFKATFKGDVETVTNVLKDGGSNHPKFSHVINDSLVLASDFCFCSFSHVRRSGNSVAHFLARKYKSGNEL